MAKDVTGATKRPGRPRPGESALSRPAILAAALALVDEQGIEALSMRRLAAALHVDPMSLYHHVPNKAALVSGVVREVFAEMARPDPADPWPERVGAWARAYRDLALAHPNLVLQIVTDTAAASEAAVLVSEPLYAALVDAGLGPRAVVDAVGTLVDFVNGYTLATAGPAGAPLDEERLAAVDPGQVPTMLRVHAALRDDPAVADGFRAGLDIIISGITG